ncbi:MAG: SH3 domain-containing protein [Anaerolineae bacterium]|nr:SH3 domain-containing protein [Anaerolineae bacterium]
MFNRYQIRLTLLVVFLLALGVAPLAQAAGGSLDFTVDCNGFTSNGSELMLTRDNTGQLQEAFTITAIDGAGNALLEPISDVFFVGGTVTWEDGEGYEWTRDPLYNPLHLQIVSPAGNGLDEQVVYDVSANCPGLAKFGAIDALTAFGRQALRLLTGEAFVLQPADGEVSDALEVNAIPPRPVNPQDVLEDQPGYAVVNTDNLYLRTGDSPSYAVIGIVDGGTELAVLGRNEDLTWWYVQVGGLRGWVSGQFLVLRGDLSGVPEVPILGELAVPTLYVGFPNNAVYAGPSMLEEVVCTIPGNREFKVLGRTAASDWYQIEVPCGADDSAEAWILADRGLLRNPAGVTIPELD